MLDNSLQLVLRMNKMNLYIRIKNGQPFEHPILEDNFLRAFPDVDIKNLPPEFAKFQRIEQPLPGSYEVYVGVTYELVDGVVTDVHHFRPMTQEERDEFDRLQAEKITAWMEENNNSPIGVSRV
jgi:hypothetical protein